MFTGLIEEIGHIQRVRLEGGAVKLAIKGQQTVSSLVIGDSIAVDGTCLTVTRTAPTLFEADLSAETMARTTLGERHAGDPVNLERPCRPTDRLGGHFVTGHIDGVGTIHEIRETEGMWWFSVAYPETLRPLLVEKGSVAVDGISLTVGRLNDRSFGVAVIQHTYHHTTLGNKQVGRRVNLETDLLGKYVVRYLEGLGPLTQKMPLTEVRLQELGFS
ncbi:riboflavin synthase subunit alpha [Candidatus Methylomirabilis lanthanidiphila]|uniref:Riboflavin synthase n=1 Tax=Candidatus Methylomirabilis lanthanidiphila TaxID=2211376 RepID=A0A564ZHF0_9BACT|nr:riboflavin synthase [Candidatus Methylomirabilis lanthanidiphila]VUZ84347.1 riboflavin synthase subunit alpha [Candidatus Methylomirabilis lanthanidiphila]